MMDLKPTPELEKALQTTTREAIQQDADKATFERRALAVERERAIAENELKNQIELAKREETLIQQRGQNERRRATEDAEAQRIATEAQGARTRIQSQAGAESIRVTEEARVQAESARMAIYRDMSGTVLMGLASRELAQKLQTIQHLNIAPDMLGPILTQLVDGARNQS
jgi:hypothetical protein